MTKELDARARAYAKKMCDQYGDEQQIWTDSYNTYIEIAAEQRKVDEADYTEQMRQLNEECEENLAIQRRMLIAEFGKIPSARMSNRFDLHDAAIYITGAKEEHQYMIDKACEAFKRIMRVQYGEDIDESMEIYFRKAMED